MSNPNQIDVSELIAQADRYSSDGEIDPTSNLNNDRVFILAGTLDTTVDPGRLLQAGTEVDLPRSSALSRCKTEIILVQGKVDDGRKLS